MTRVSLLRRDTMRRQARGRRITPRGSLRGSWTCLPASAISRACSRKTATSTLPVSADLELVLRGRALPAEDRRVLAAFAAEVAVAYEQRQLREAAAAAIPAREADRMRTALLNAVSHDLRSPLAVAKATVTSLRSADVDWPEADRQQLLASADAALDRLTDSSRTCSISRVCRPACCRSSRAALGLEDVVNLTVERLGAPAGAVDVDVPTDLPEVLADAGPARSGHRQPRAERVALQPCRYCGAAGAGSTQSARVVELRVIDRGPGIPRSRAGAGLCALPASRRPRPPPPAPVSAWGWRSRGGLLRRWAAP